MVARPEPIPGDHDLTWSELGDGLWLMAAIEARSPTRAPESAAEPERPHSPGHPGRVGEPNPESGTTQPPEWPAAGSGKVSREEERPVSAGPGGEPGGFPAPSVVEPAGSPVGEAATLGVSSTPVLPGAAAMLRALRPFKRKVRTTDPDDVELDEERTAERAAQTGTWLPVTRPGRSRWLDLTVVIDSSPSTVLWTPTVNAFVQLIERLGAFRSLRVRLLETGKTGTAEGGAVLGPVLRGGTSEAPSRGPREVIGSSRRSLVLLVTDGISDAWRRDLVSPMLAQWARAMPTAIVHLLPQRLWARGGVAVHQTILTPPGPLRPNRYYHVRPADPLLDREEAAELTAGAVAVPVLELGDRWLRWWANLVTGTGTAPRKATVVLARDEPRPVDPDAALGERSATERVRNFHSSASPSAFRLATLLAAVPVDIGIARALQAELVPESGPDDLAEVFTSGLLEQVRGETSWDRTQWEFSGQVRETLLRGARRSETAHAVLAASRQFGDRLPVLARLRAALAAPDSTPDPVLPTATPSDIALERDLMRALSGPYLSRASRLEHRLPSTGTTPDPGKEKSNTMASDTMSEGLKTPASEGVEEKVVDTHPPVDDIPPNVRSRVVATVAEATARYERRTGDEAPPIWGSIPPKNPNFTGRHELLDQLSQRLGAGTTAVLPAALHGMGGIGKTQMAVEYIYRHLQDYDVVWWIQATRATQIRTSLTELAQHLRLPGAEESITAVPAVREALRLGRPYRRWLLVFDSAEDPEMVRPFFPVDGPGQILVTSRNPSWAGIARPLEVAVFRREESRKLLTMRRLALSEEDADRIAEKLGDLPLGIDQAAAWLAETGMPAVEYLRLFDEKVNEILDTSSPTDYELSVAAAWNVSFDQLSSSNPAAHQLLQVCAFFAPEPISRSLFTGVRGISVSPELDSALRDPMRLGRAVRDINRYGLAKIDHRSDTLLLHRLVQLVLRNRMSEQHRREMRHGAHLLLARLDPNDPASSRQWPRYQEILPHIYDAELLECTDLWVRQLVLNLMRFLYSWGDHQGALTLAERAVEAWQRDRKEREARGEEPLEEVPALEMEASERLGFYLWTVGHYSEAAEVSRRTLDWYRETRGPNSEEALNAQRTFAMILKARGEFAEAREFNQDVYTKSRGLFGEDDPTTISAGHDLVVALLLVGDYRAARDLAEEIYARSVEVFGYDNVGPIATQVLLVLARRELGDYPWARIEQERIAERAEQMYGGDSVGTLRRRYFQSVACRKDGDHEAALALSGDALERFRTRYGNDHPNAMACALGHSIDLRHARMLTEAKKRGEEVFNLYRQNLGENHPHTLSAALDLGVTLRLGGDPAAARVLDERALEQFRAALGEDHPHTIVCAIDVASDWAALDRVEEAAELDAELLERSRRVLGADHPTTLAVQLNRVLDLIALGREVEAGELYEDVMTRYRLVLGETHPGTIAASKKTRADCDIDPMPL
ncbi:FxSxx-COOH system tetratricopeptide repeat protein [Amycolatopsis sp. NPDC003731]